MKLTVPTSIILAALILVIGFFAFDYYKSFQARKVCEEAWEGYENSQERIAQCVLINTK